VSHIKHTLGIKNVYVKENVQAFFNYSNFAITKDTASLSMKMPLRRSISGLRPEPGQD